KGDEPDGQRKQARRRHRHDPDYGHLVRAGKAEEKRHAVECVCGKDAYRIAANAEKGGVAEGDKPAQPEGDVEPCCSKGEDSNPSGKGDEKRLTRQLRQEGGGKKRKDQKGVD